MTLDGIRQQAMDAGYIVSLPSHTPDDRPWATLTVEECVTLAGTDMSPAQHEACRDRFEYLRANPTPACPDGNPDCPNAGRPIGWGFHRECIQQMRERTRPPMTLAEAQSEARASIAAGQPDFLATPVTGLRSDR